MPFAHLLSVALPISVRGLGRDANTKERKKEKPAFLVWRRNCLKTLYEQVLDMLKYFNSNLFKRVF